VVFQAIPPASSFRNVFFQAFGEPTEPNGVKVSKIIADPRPPRQIYDPKHPDADEKGLVRLPNVNVIEEMTNMLAASRSYEANLAVLETGKTMVLRALEMGR
jgi:flagellar basal-body rod protein FlgC